MTALVVTALVTVLVLASLVWLLVELAEAESSRSSNGPESALSLVFVSAAVVLILVVCTLTIVLKRLRLTNPNEAMGLPRGSIRAVIALLLILLFFIAAIFLYNSTRDAAGDRTENRELKGISATRFAAIPTELIQTATSRTLNDELVYDVTLYPSSANTTTSDDLAKQLITVLGTLVTAVAAFYFGSNSLKDAAGLGERPATRLTANGPPEPLAGGPLTGGPPTGVTGESVTGESVTGEPPTGEPPPEEPPPEEPPTGEPPTGEPPPTRETSSEEPLSDSPSVERPGQPPTEDPPNR